MALAFSSFVGLTGMVIYPVDERIKELCQKAVTANDAEAPAIFAELKILLQEHSATVRFLVAKTLNRGRQTRPSSSSQAT